MEFDNILTVLQARLQSAQRNTITQFVDIVNSDDEEHEKALSLIEGAIRELNLSEDDQRRVHLLFLLNSSFYSTSYFKNDKNFAQIIGCIPKISDYIYFKIIVIMEWQKFMGEAILFCPEILTVDILKSLEKNLYLILKSLEIDFDVMDSNKATEFIYTLYGALFKKIHITECKIKRQRIVKYFVNLLSFDFKEVSEVYIYERERYLGHVYKMYMDLVQCCIRYLHEPSIVKPEIYNFTLEFDYSKWPKPGETDWVKYCLNVITLKTAEPLKDIWHYRVTWSVLPLNAKKCLYTTIMETAYFCCETIKTVPELYDSVPGLEMLEKTLERISSPPFVDDDEISKEDPNTIIKNIVNCEDITWKWYLGLINLGIFDNPEYMEVTRENAGLIGDASLLSLLHQAIEYITKQSVSNDKLAEIKDIVFTCAKELFIIDCDLVIEKYLEEYGFTDILCSEDFEKRLTTLLNEFVLGQREFDEVFKDIFCLSIENPESLLTICLNECLTSKQKCDAIIRILYYVRSILRIKDKGFIILSEMADRVAKGHNDKHREHFIYLVQTLSKPPKIDSLKFLKEYVLLLFERALTEEDLLALTFYQEIISVITNINRYDSIELIILIAKSMDRVRPKHTSFKMAAIKFISDGSKLLSPLVKRFVRHKEDEDDEEIKRLRDLACHLSPLISTYMTPIWEKWSKEPPFNRDNPDVYWAISGFGKGKILAELNKQQRFNIVSALIEVLPQLTRSEWEMIGRNEQSKNKEDLRSTRLAEFHVLVDCILMLYQMPFISKDTVCLEHTLTNFIHYTKVNIVKSLKEYNRVERVGITEKIDLIANQLAEFLTKSQATNLVVLQNSIKKLG